jgi:hypothetical protein
MATGFSRDIRPYFTACYRSHMIKFRQIDLWLEADVQSRWQDIFDNVEAENMPPAADQPGACPEGGWDDITRAQFLTDFQSWKDGAFQP